MESYPHRMHQVGHIRTWVDGLATACLVDTVDNKGFIGLQVHAIEQPGSGRQKKYILKISGVRTTDFRPGFFPPGVYVVNNIPNDLTDYEKKSGWRLLFDGSSPKGWVKAYTKRPFLIMAGRSKTGTLTVLAAGGDETMAVEIS
jgi:hypothetical protein